MGFDPLCMAMCGGGSNDSEQIVQLPIDEDFGALYSQMLFDVSAQADTNKGVIQLGDIGSFWSYVPVDGKDPIISATMGKYRAFCRTTSIVLRDGIPAQISFSLRMYYPDTGRMCDFNWTIGRNTDQTSTMFKNHTCYSQALN